MCESQGGPPANSKTCTKFMEEEAILRYRVSNGGTFKQARAAVVVNVGKEIRPKLFTQVVRGTSTRAVTTSATVKESVGVPSQVSTTARDGPALKKEDTSETVFRQEFAQLREKYAAYKEAFTDGSKSEKVAAASFYPKDPDEPDQTRLNDDSTVFIAELEGTSLALKYFKRKRFLRSVIYTDSLSALQALQGKIFKNKNVARIYNLLAKMAPRTKVVLVWIPSHVGIPGNEKVDELAKLALNKEVHDDKPVIWSDLKLKAKTHVEQLW
ncbi:RNA-directed DNA polymerase from mobile element jockey [Elysia marginata]|uniref:RNA-directed DNA polymerase from mobile element jockey n=1 Tax=Elysia marginata TaxID=1093978 RepID=A0AAV4JMZ6_9GAST|nr:RNA-directed DNA polymerase from mobile element jockey [Elysia marginata]